MLIEFFLERARIVLAEDRMSYRGYVPDLPEIHVSAPTQEQCRAKLAGAITAILAIDARRGLSGDAGNESDPRSPESGDETGDAAEQPERRVTGEAHGNSSPEFKDIIYEKRDLIARVTINRPSVYNTYTDRTLRELAAAFREAARDDSVGVLVLTGAGDRAFSAGGDVRQHSQEHVGNVQAAREWLNALIDAHTALRQLDKPSIARINGMVAGGGNEWNLACDLAIAADHVKFVQVETKVGLVSAAGATHWLALFIGERRAREVFLTGEPISANKALLWGLVNDVVPYKQLDKAVNGLCQKLVDRFPESTRFTREQLSFWRDLAWNAIVKRATDQIAQHFAGDEASEGMRALVDKREIDYRRFRKNAGVSDDSGSVVSEGPARPTTGAGRSCYSCGAEGIPASYQYCGICGTRVV